MLNVLYTCTYVSEFVDSLFFYIRWIFMKKRKFSGWFNL